MSSKSGRSARTIIAPLAGSDACACMGCAPPTRRTPTAVLPAACAWSPARKNRSDLSRSPLRQASLTGCDILVRPSIAQQFALVAHELATNSLKYGALSSPTGHVSIEGKADRIESVGVSLLWKECGDPFVSKPTRKGFGSVILLDYQSLQTFEVYRLLSLAHNSLWYPLLSRSTLEYLPSLPLDCSSSH